MKRCYCKDVAYILEILAIIQKCWRYIRNIEKEMEKYFLIKLSEFVKLKIVQMLVQHCLENKSKM